MTRELHHAVRTAPGALVVAIAVCVSGCAPLLHRGARNYATVEADPRHDTDEARKQYSKAMRYFDASCCRPGADLSKAEEHLHSALVADVRFAPAHNALGVVYYHQDRLYLAAWEFEYAAKLMPNSFEPLNNLGLVYEAAGKFDQAAFYYQQARQLAPTQPEVVSNLARALLRSDQSVDEVRSVLDDVIALDPRPEWRRWAAEKLGLNPEAEQTDDAESATSGPETPTPTSELLPIPGNPFLDDRTRDEGPLLQTGLFAEPHTSESTGDVDRLQRAFDLDVVRPPSERSVWITDQMEEADQTSFSDLLRQH